MIWIVLLILCLALIAAVAFWRLIAGHMPALELFLKRVEGDPRFREAPK